MAGGVFAPIGQERDPSLALINRARQALGRATPTGERPLEARLRTLQAAAGNAAVTRMLQRESADGAGRAGEVGGETRGAEAPAPSHSMLKYGARGDEVRELQTTLNQANTSMPALVIDGIFGRKTQAAVRQFQRAHPPLTIDGDVGPETWAAIDAAPATDGGAKAEAADDGGSVAEPADPYEAGKVHYMAGRYGQAYDEFTKAYESSADPVHLWNRGLALMNLGGRREEAIALFEQFLALDVATDAKDNARKKLAELRGPGKSTDEAANRSAVADLHRKGSELYGAEQYGRAYDEFTKAYEITGDPAMLWNRAQSLRFLGGRRAETIALYEQLIGSTVNEDRKAAARRDIEEVRGPGKGADEAANKTAVDIYFKKGRELFRTERYAQAYDEFSRAHEISREPALLYNRAQALRLMGGRRAQAIELFEQFLASEVSEESKKSARAFLEDLRGPGKPRDGGPSQPRQ